MSMEHLSDPERQLLLRAIHLGRSNIASQQGGPFGAVISIDGEIVAEGWSQVTSTNDPTAHAEMVAIRRACSQLKRFHLANSVLFTSCEPCPMCLAASYWAQISKIIYAGTRDDAAAIGFDDASIYKEVSLSAGDRRIPMTQSNRDEAAKMMRDWSVSPKRAMY